MFAVEVVLFGAVGCLSNALDGSVFAVVGCEEGSMLSELGWVVVS